MPTLTIEYTTEAERLAYERAITFVAEMNRLGMQAPAGTVIDACEGLALSQGRALIQATLADAVQARVDEAEKKGARHAPVRVDTRAAAKDDTNAPS